MPIKLALIGMQGHWYELTEALPSLPEVHLAAVADENVEALKRVPNLPGTTPETKTFTDYRELLAQTKPEVVVEAGIDSTRADILLACAERGIDFICEKPLAKTRAELERVQAAVEKSGIAASMLITMRCAPNYLAMRAAVEQGVIGEVIQGGAQKSYRLGTRPEWQKHRETFSGIIPFVGIHVIDLLRWVSGREYAEVMAMPPTSRIPRRAIWRITCACWPSWITAPRPPSGWTTVAPRPRPPMGTIVCAWPAAAG